MTDHHAIHLQKADVLEAALILADQVDAMHEHDSVLVQQHWPKLWEAVVMVRREVRKLEKLDR